MSNVIRDTKQIPDLHLNRDTKTKENRHFGQYDRAREGNGHSLQNNLAKPVPAAGQLALVLRRGVTIDRQYHTVPNPPAIRPDKIALVKSMGFDFVKLINNPAVHKSGSAITNMDYIDTIVNIVISQGMKVIVCVHPEPEFKNTVFGNQSEFNSLCTWYQNFAGYLAVRWHPEKFVFQLMTEPFGTSSNPQDWNHWNKLQPEMWAAVRRGMPEHTLILSGDQIGIIEGLILVEPVNDGNVMYAFSHYEPFIFTLQGDPWVAAEFGMYMPYIQHVPYPSSPETIAAALPDILSNVPADMQSDAIRGLQVYGEERWNRNKLAERIQMLVDWSRSYSSGPKLFCGEFGCLHWSVEPRDRYAFIKDLREVLEEKGISWSYWSFNETFTVLNNGMPDERMLAALFGQSR